MENDEKGYELSSKEESKTAEQLSINQGTKDRVMALRDLSKSLADNFVDNTVVDMKTHSITLSAIDKIRKATDSISKLNGNEPDYEFQLRHAEQKCVAVLGDLYASLGKSPKILRTAIPTNSNKVANLIFGFMQKTYTDFLKTSLGIERFAKINMTAGTEILFYTSYILQMRVARVSAKPDSSLAVFEAFTAMDNLQEQRLGNFYDGKTFLLTKSPLPQTMGALFLAASTAWVKHDVTKQQTETLSLLKDARQDAQRQNTYLFDGPIIRPHLKELITLNGTLFSNPVWDPGQEKNYYSSANKANIGNTGIVHIFIVAPGNLEMDRIPSNKHQVYFLTSDRAKEFMQQAATHPYWYDEKLGWNLAGWPHLMEPKDHIVSHLEERFLDRRITRSFLMKEGVMLPQLETSKQEMEGLKAIIEAVRSAPSAASALEMIEATIDTLRMDRTDELELKETTSTPSHNALIEIMNNILDPDARNKLKSELEKQLPELKEIVQENETKYTR